jgi:hypothetical protein
MQAGFSIQDENVNSSLGRDRIKPEEFYRHDPVLVLLKDKLRLNTSWIILGSIALLVGYNFGLRMVVPYGPPAPLSVKTFFRLLDICAYVLFYTVYLSLPQAIADLFNTLRTNGIIGEPLQDQPGSTTYAGFLSELVSWADSTWWLAGVLPFVALYFLYRFLVRTPQIAHAGFLAPPFWLQVVNALLDVTVAYTAFLSVVRLVVALVFTRRLFRSFMIQVKPLHPDGRGGLGIMRHILWMNAGMMLAAAMAFFEADWLLSSPVDEVVLTAAYVVLVPALLLGWLVLPHQAMVKARDAELQPLVDEFQQALKETTPSAKDDAKIIDAGIERLSALKRRYEFLCSIFPTWPLELREMHQLIVALSLPALIPLVFPYLKDLFTFISRYIHLG